MEVFGQTPNQQRALHAYVCLMRAAAAVTRRIHGHLAEDDLVPSQFGVLEALLHRGPQCQRELAERVLCSPNNMTALVDRLEERGLVVRRADEADRRMKRVHLTGAGTQLVRRAFARHAKVLEEDLSVLDAQEQEALAALCRKLGLRGRAGADGAGPGHEAEYEGRREEGGTT
jgi:MarR family 2-MHQ and catechol resistance regulon transcriptional repressor